MITLKDITPEQYSTYVGVLTVEDKDSLIGQWYMADSYFNPIQDIDDKWVISVEEISQCINPDAYTWYESSRFRLETNVVATGQIKVAYYGYGALATKVGAGAYRFMVA